MKQAVFTGSVRWGQRARVALLGWVGVIICAGGATGDTPTLAVGDTMPEIALEDQHGEPRAIGRTTRIVLFSRDMDGGELLKAGLADAAPGFLAEHDAVYLSDISGMPRLVARMFALPSMRRRAYPMLLDRTGEATAELPDQPGQATLIFLRELRIERIEHVSSAEVVVTLITHPPVPAASGN
jgi:hypothetical protein